MEDRQPVPPLTPAPDTAMRVPDHELVRFIGRGSYGEVWLGRNTLGTYRAIKLVYEKTFRHKRPFEREFNGVQKFEPVSRSHEGLTDILQVGRDEAAGYFYYVMELADDVAHGQAIDPENYSPRTLAHDVAHHQRLPPEECRRVGVAIATALDCLHGHGLIHRDVKPSNIVFVNGVPKLADIGLVAEMSEARSYVGTEGFIPPEGPGSVQSDLYSLGKVLYEISTGKDRHDYPDLPTCVEGTEAERQLLELNKVVIKACRADPGQRYKSAGAMVEDLELLSGHAGPRPRGRRRSRVAIWTAVAAAVVVVIVAMVAAWPGATPVPRNYEPVSGPPGARLTISGDHFDASPSGNIVYFGAVRAEVLSVTPTNLTASVPEGATYAPVTVVWTNGFVTSGSTPFLPTFAGVGGITTSSLVQRLELPTGAGPCDSAIADFDGDGRPDVAFANWGANTVSVYRNAGAQHRFTTFDPPALVAAGQGVECPQNITAADVDGDGRIDLVVADPNADRLLIFKNISTPSALTTNSFAAPVRFVIQADPRTVAVRDVDGDGLPDLVVACQGTSTICILRNLGVLKEITEESFAPLVSLRAGANPQDVVVGDLDRDGKPDLAVANLSAGSVSVFRNISKPGRIDVNSFEPRVDLPAPYHSVAIAMGDLDGDGWADLIVGSWQEGRMLSVYRNVSRPGSLSLRSFAPRLDFPADARVHDVAIGDFNGDGKPDVALVTELPDRLSLFENRSKPGEFDRDSFGPRVDFIPSGTNAVGVAVVDLDGDHRPDIVFANAYSGRISVFQNVSPVRPR